MQAITQPLKYHGGKHYLAPWIISHMPPHLHYVEPYFGGGSVLLRKDPTGISEVVNDIDGDLTDFWTVLSTPKFFDQLIRRCEATPFSELVFESAMQNLNDRETIQFLADPVRRAWCFFVVARQSRQGLMKDFATLSRNRTRRGMNEQVSSWLTAIDGLPDVHARMQRVVILNRPALEVIATQDGPNTLFYCDPPYLLDTRSAGGYRHEMIVEEHHALLCALSKIEGKFLLSGYPSAMYEAMARAQGWRCATVLIDNKASSRKEKEVKTECLWMNY